MSNSSLSAGRKQKPRFGVMASHAPPLPPVSHHWVSNEATIKEQKNKNMLLKVTFFHRGIKLDLSRHRHDLGIYIHGSVIAEVLYKYGK